MTRAKTQAAAAVTQVNELPVHEYYDYMAKQVEREDGLINARITWMLTFEGFLFASLALIGGKSTIPILNHVLPALGIIISLLCYSSVEGALSAIKTLKTGWEEKERSLGIAGVYPRAFGKARPHLFAVIHTRLLPLVVASAWGLIWWASIRP